MIPYADLERAINRWKSRQAGATTGVEPVAVEEQTATGEIDAEAYAEVAQETSSGMIQLEAETEMDDDN